MPNSARSAMRFGSCRQPASPSRRAPEAALRGAEPALRCGGRRRCQPGAARDGRKGSRHADRAIALDRRLFAAVAYPTDYGFIAETIAGDGDELDAMVAVTEPTFPGCSVAAKPIALLKMRDGETRIDKVLTVPVSDPSWSGLDDLKEMPGFLAREIEHFFEVYSEIEGTGWELEGWGSSEDAKELIESCRERYRGNGSGS